MEVADTYDNYILDKVAMQEVEEELSKLSQSKQDPLIQQIVVQLNDAVVYAQGSNADEDSESILDVL
ncbi:hypothetical protein EON64_14495 [archaeon]|nr:MAG: hypothetical protein EON64_14495 [archaeon]